MFEQKKTLENCLAIAGAGSLNWPALFTAEEQTNLTEWAQRRKLKELQREDKSSAAANCCLS